MYSCFTEFILATPQFPDPGCDFIKIELVRLVNEEMDNTAGNYREELDVISGEIAGINSRLERLYDALETDKLGLDDLAPRIQQLRYPQEQLQSRKWELEALLSDRRVELTDMEVVTRCVEDLRDLLEESELAGRKAFVRSFVREVRVIGNEVLLTYTMPFPPEKISEERIGVLYSVHPSGPGSGSVKAGVVFGSGSAGVGAGLGSGSIGAGARPVFSVSVTEGI
jgi:hypothetical protein